ncbi:MAG: glycosyltransferase, partial [Verrucomicrobiota bacterium]
QNKLGHSGEVLSLDAPAKMAGKLPFTVHEIGPAKGSYGYSKRLVPWLKRHRKNYDAVVAHGLWQHVGYATRQALHGSGTPYYVFPHGMLDPWFKQAYPRKHLKKQLYWRWGEYRVLRDARAVLFTCEEERRLARLSFKQYAANESVVGLGIAEPPDDIDAARLAFQQAYPEIHDRALLFLGRIDPKKGLDLLIKAYRELQEGGRELPPLVLAGPDADSTYAQELRTLLGDTPGVHFTGMLKGELKWGALAQCAALVLPSHQENFGIVVAEALALGKPVLISDKVNIFKEVFTDGAGLVEADTLEGTRKLLKRWLELSAHEHEMLKAMARPCYVKRFAIEQVAERMLEVFR